MIGSLPSESLVAMTGIFPTHAPSELAVRGAEAYPTRIRRRLAAFLEADAPEPMKWERPPVQGDLWRDLTELLDPQKIHEWMTDVPLEMMAGYATIIQQARDRIKSAWPLYPDTSLGVQMTELAQDEYGDVWHLCRTLDDPETMFDDMDAMLLLPSQVEAFAAVYPDLYETTRNLAMLLLQPYVQIDPTKKPRKTLRWDREEQIRTLLQVPLDAPIETAEGAQQPAQAAKAKPDKSEEIETDDAQTPSEHTTARRIANK